MHPSKRMPVLVEPLTVRRVSAFAQKVNRRANGETIVRCVILAAMVFVVVQLYQRRVADTSE